MTYLGKKIPCFTSDRYDPKGKPQQALDSLPRTGVDRCELYRFTGPFQARPHQREALHHHSANQRIIKGPR